MAHTVASRHGAARSNAAGDGPPVRVVHLMWRLSRGGGVQTVVRQIAAGVDPAVVELHVVSARPRRDMDRIDDLPVAFHSIEVPFTATTGVRSQLRALVKAAVMLRQLRPDVVHVHSGTVWMAGLASLVQPRVPYVFEVHDAPGSGRHSNGTERAEGIWARLRRVTVLVHSTSVEHEVAAAWTIDRRRLRRIPLAVDLDRTDRALDGFTDDRPSPRPFTVAAVGRMVPLKRFGLAAEAVAQLVAGGVDARLVLIGDGPQRDVLTEQAAALGISDRVELAGYVDDDGLVQRLHDADVLVSTSEYEGFGLTLLEAMAAGTPTIAMAVGGVTDIVDDGVTGYLVGSGDVDAMAARLAEVAADPALAARLGAAARARVEERFSTTVFAAGMEELYTELA